HEEWISAHTDMYFVGSDSTKNTLIANGIPHEHIAVSGIPVNRHFKQGCNVGTRSSQSEILIMGGGWGLIPCVSKMLAEMAQDKQLHVTIICGKNARLKNKLTQKYPTVEVVGFTDKVAQYMQRADLLITKAGGITTFEAIYCHTPLYVCTPFLMQEVGNAEFIEQNNIGKVVWSKKTDIASDVLALIKNTALLNMMKYNMCALQSRLCDRCVVKQLLADSCK
ncbi:MAG: glycosyltransferase, partial [Oscillospiraceae bacterium]